MVGLPDLELARLLQMSQSPTLTPGQRTVLASHFGLVAAELVTARAELFSHARKLEALRRITTDGERAESDDKYYAAICAVKEAMGWD